VSERERRRDDDRALQVALFRYGVVARLVEAEAGAGAGVAARVREIAGEPHYLPGRGPVRVSERTVYAWLAAFRKGGVEALRPAVRKDRGESRAVEAHVLARAIRLRREQPRRTTTTLLDILVREGTVQEPLPFHRATLDRWLRRKGASRKRLATLSTKPKIKMRFEHFGDLWVGDDHHGPLVRKPDGGVATSKLGAFLDHTTRYPVADRYYLAEDLPTLRDTLLRALLAFGTPKVVYVERGSVYRAEQRAYSLARVQCRLVHSRPYYSEGRGVVERWWQVALAFEDEVRARPELPTLHELNALWEAYREERYCRQKLLEHARPLAYADLDTDPGFTAERFAAVVAELGGLDLRTPEKRALLAFWKTFGPLPEDLVRIGVEHAVRLHGRGRHTDVYLHAVKTLVLAHWRGGKEKR